MSMAAGALSKISNTDTTDVVSSAVATGGTTPYTYQWYRSTTTSFTPGSGNLIAGATALQLSDSSLIPGTTYFYKVIATDTAATPVSATSSQLSVTLDQQAQSPNQFAESTIVGDLDLRYNFNTVAVQIDSSSADLFAGSPVKMVDSAGGVPKVTACTASSDEVLGFINFNIKNRVFSANAPAEISMAGNVMWMYATGAIARGTQVVLDLANNGVAQASGSGGEDVVGWAYDKAAGLGSLIRVYIKTPSFAKDA